MAAHAETGAVVSKGAFAKILNVSPGRVSQYIAEGKLTGAALEGEGRLAKINVAIAREQLRRHLDIGQMLGNGIDTRLSKPVGSGRPPAPKSAASAQPSESSPSLGSLNLEPVEDQLKRERLFQEQIRSRKAAEDEQARKGRFTDTEEVRAANMRIAGEMIQTFEGALPTMAAAVASKFEVPVRDVLHLLRIEFTNMRAKAAEQLREKAFDLPETVQTEIGTGDMDDLA